MGSIQRWKVVGGGKALVVVRCWLLGGIGSGKVLAVEGLG